MTGHHAGRSDQTPPERPRDERDHPGRAHDTVRTNREQPRPEHPDATEPDASEAGPSGVGPSDGQLARAAAAGDRPSFDELVRRHHRQAMAVSYRLLGSSDDAAEVVQDALLKAYRKLPTLQTPDAFAGWLMRIVRNLSLNRRRSRSLRSASSIDDENAGPISSQAGTGTTGEQSVGSFDPARSAEGRELGQHLQRALEKLPERQRLALVMFTMEDRPQKEIAEELGCSVEAVKWHVFQARKKLRDLLANVM